MIHGTGNQSPWLLGVEPNSIHSRDRTFQDLKQCKVANGIDMYIMLKSNCKERAVGI